MNFSIKKEEFVNIINDCFKIVAIKSPQHILTYFKLTLNENGLFLVGGNNSITVQSFQKLKDNDTEIINIQEEGEICVPSRVFSEIIKKFPSDIIQIYIENDEVIIKKGKIKYKIKYLNANEYPLLPKHNINNGYNILTKDLKKILNKTLYAAALTKQRPFLTGINWIIKDNTLTCIATDNHRLARIKINFTCDLEENIIIPKKNLEELNKFLIDDNQTIDIFFLDRQILFKINNVLFYSRLLEGNYPNIDRTIPKEIKTTAIINAKHFQESLDRVSIITKEVKETTIRLEINEDYVKIESLNTTIGEVQEEIPIVELNGESLNLTVNPQYFIDILKTVNNKNIILEYTNSVVALILKEIEEPEIIQLILPVKH